MRRRDFIGLLGAAAWPSSALLCFALFLGSTVSNAPAQSVPVLGYAANKNADQTRLDAFTRGLAELGYFDGKNLRIDFREGVLDADYDRLMTQFVAAKVDIILAANAPAAVAAAATERGDRSL